MNVFYFVRPREMPPISKHITRDGKPAIDPELLSFDTQEEADEYKKLLFTRPVYKFLRRSEAERYVEFVGTKYPEFGVLDIIKSYTQPEEWEGPQPSRTSDAW